MTIQGQDRDALSCRKSQASELDEGASLIPRVFDPNELGTFGSKWSPQRSRQLALPWQHAVRASPSRFANGALKASTFRLPVSDMVAHTLLTASSAVEPSLRAPATDRSQAPRPGPLAPNR